jgi:UDP-N-acetylglucosamine/UDP-N-acetylgalactosamine diphosphorylase
MVGPLRIGYGNVVAAGAILRDGVCEGNKLIIGKSCEGGFSIYPQPLFSPCCVKNNIVYLSFGSWSKWHVHVRQSFFREQEFGELLYAGAVEKVSRAKQERLTRLKAMAEKMPDSLVRSAKGKAGIRKKEFRDRISELIHLFSTPLPSGHGEKQDRFLESFLKHKADHSGAYIDVIRGMQAPLADSGTNWLRESSMITVQEHPRSTVF